MNGYRKEFDQALEAIEVRVIGLFAMIGGDLPRATAALLGGDDETLRHLVRHQQETKAWYPQLEAMVSREILRQAPVASDLRFLLSVLSAAREFERAHCSLVHIASRASARLTADLSPASRVLIARIGDLAAEMWRITADAWYQRDRLAMDVLAVQHADLDELCAAMMAELASGAMSVPVTMDLTLVARFYERLGDHAIKIAGQVRYLAGSMSA